MIQAQRGGQKRLKPHSARGGFFKRHVIRNFYHFVCMYAGVGDKTAKTGNGKDAVADVEPAHPASDGLHDA